MIERILSKLSSIPADKVMHCMMGVALFAVLLPFIGPVYAVAAVTGIGFAKELYDSVNKESHTPDIWDALATAAGGLLGFYCTTF
jgi:hypothetical protein